MIEGVKCDGEQNKRLSDFCVAQHDRSDGGSVIVSFFIQGFTEFYVIRNGQGSDI